MMNMNAFRSQFCLIVKPQFDRTFKLSHSINEHTRPTAVMMTCKKSICSYKNFSDRADTLQSLGCDYTAPNVKKINCNNFLLCLKKLDKSVKLASPFCRTPTDYHRDLKSLTFRCMSSVAVLSRHPITCREDISILKNWGFSNKDFICKPEKDLDSFVRHYNESSSWGGTNDSNRMKIKRDNLKTEWGKEEETSSGHNVLMRGLPFSAEESDITEFFQPLKPINVFVKLNSSNRPSGYAVVRFATHNDAVEAMKKDRCYIKHRYVELFLKSSNVDSTSSEPSNSMDGGSVSSTDMSLEGGGIATRENNVGDTGRDGTGSG